MSIQEGKKYISDTVERNFATQVANFSIEICEMTLPQASYVVWKFDIQFTCLINGEVQTISDGVDEGKVQEILERVWLSILAIAEHSEDNSKSELVERLKQQGKDLGFVLSEENGR